ncbi:MAG: hypothetical protein ACTH1D_02420 [Mycobacteriaceae bacterium]
MCAGRDKGPGWIEVGASTVGREEFPGEWVAVALDVNHAVTRGSS